MIPLQFLFPGHAETKVSSSCIYVYLYDFQTIFLGPVEINILYSWFRYSSQSQGLGFPISLSNDFLRILQESTFCMIPSQFLRPGHTETKVSFIFLLLYHFQPIFLGFYKFVYKFFYISFLISVFISGASFFEHPYRGDFFFHLIRCRVTQNETKTTL